MNSLVFSACARFLLPLMLLFSFFLVVRGHNEPGGGFAGGLVAASAFIVLLFADGVESMRRALRCEPQSLIPAGLAVALGSGLPSLVAGRPFLTPYWAELPLVGKIGTPVVFDVGVYLVVVGITLTIAVALAEDR